MSDRNGIQLTLDEFAQESGARKKSGSWYRRSPETIVVLNLQKSNYAARYFLNVALWLLPLGEADAPKENKCHVRTRITQLVPHELEERVDELLDLGSAIEDSTRRDQLLGLLRSHLLPMLESASTLEGLRSGAGERLVERSLVTGPAQRLLAGHSIS